MRNSVIAALAVALLAHACGGGIQTAHAQQAVVERAPLCAIVLHDRIGMVIERDEAQTYRLFTTQKTFRSAMIFRDADAVAWACIEREGALPDTLVRLSDPLLVSMAQKIDQWQAVERGVDFDASRPPVMQHVCPIPEDMRERIRRASGGSVRPRMDWSVADTPPAMVPVAEAPRRDVTVKVASPDTVRQRTVRRVVRAPDPDVLPFALSRPIPDIPRRHAWFAIGMGFGMNSYPDVDAANRQMQELQTQLAFQSTQTVVFGVRFRTPWFVTVAAEFSGEASDVVVRYELDMLRGAPRVFAGMGYGSTKLRVESSSFIATADQKGLCLSAGLVLDRDIFSFEAGVSLTEAAELRTTGAPPPESGGTLPVDLFIDISRVSFRLQMFILF